jgi:hypothetical protein
MGRIVKRLGAIGGVPSGVLHQGDHQSEVVRLLHKERDQYQTIVATPSGGIHGNVTP